ncbi:class I SAM-dependent methyltransferase [Labrenzia sp. CE80]|uniref:class I SAM-dependent methyltransferase n=1 Tax=Labrenzia sp. CE80 TaxID=1788986 RepID=UPI00129BF38A|nr:class I SAM-dependent methyltransferase [Labrenzia sp. CE80]
MSHDDQTLDFYAREAEAYTSREKVENRQRLLTFLSALPDNARILELGCGAGQDSEFMISQGYSVQPTDGSPEIAKAAQARLGIPVQQLLFEDLDDQAAYDGIWANACLLHVPRTSLASVLAHVFAALRGGGQFFASFKAGEEDGRDRFGRYYNYPSARRLKDLYKTLPWQSVVIESGKGGGYDGLPTDWLYVTATKTR